MKETREERAKRLYDKAKKDTAEENLRNILSECVTSGLLDVSIDEETGEEKYKPTAYGVRLAGGDPKDYGIKE